VLDRTLNVLNVLGEAGESLGPAELARRLSLHKTTTHRLLKALEGLGFVRRDPREGKYSLGVKLFELGSRAVAGFQLRERAEPILRRLVEQTRETAHVCIIDGSEMVSIVNVEGPWTMRSPSTVGHRTPLYCTSVGKAVIAFLSDDVLDKLIDGLALKPFTPRTLVTRASLKADLARVRDRGFAVDDEEIEQGLRCVGAPVRNHTGLVVAAISVAGPAFRLTNQRLFATARAVTEAARDLSKEMGYSGKEARESNVPDKPPAGDVRRAVSGATERYRKSRAARNQERVRSTPGAGRRRHTQ
jgi:DNA-binding IclR family transcriptional regulator